MIKKYRDLFNGAFSVSRYEAFQEDVKKDFDYLPTFRMAESPLFINREFKQKLKDATASVIDFVKKDSFKDLTDKALSFGNRVPNEDAHPHFLAIDFGVCEEEGELVPKLIEVQGFPSIFNFQYNLFEKFKNHYPFLEQLTPFFEGITPEIYLSELDKTIRNAHPKEQVVLLEIEPEKQNTKIDFYYCHRDLGIPVLCVTEIIKKGKKLYYHNDKGETIEIKRIYNRVIFDELDLRNDLKLQFDFREELDVEWAGHPNWFFRISKFILPYLKGPYFIETTLLSDLKQIPEDLENYVLKPLFSFSGSGVVFHVKESDITAVREKDQYILQKKVHYAPVLQAPDGKVKAEVRILAVWPDDRESPLLMSNLVRLSRGEMIGVKFNKDKDWVGGTIGLFEP